VNVEPTVDMLNAEVNVIVQVYVYRCD